MQDTLTEQRGSDRLFEMKMHDSSALAEAIGAASNDYEIKWWWIYGTPAIDYINGGLQVGRDRIGQVLGRLLDLNTEQVQVNARVLVNGIPKPDGFQVEFDMRRGPGR